MDNSPIEQVRLTVLATDDPTMQVLTLRTWLLGLPLCIVQSILMRMVTFRQQVISIYGIFGNILLFIGGKFLAKVLPNKIIRIPWIGWSFSLNPGPFNLKEHVAMVMLVSTGGSVPGIENVSISKIFYHRDIHPMPAFMFVLSNQLAGLGFTGIFLKFLVDSPYMWWPLNLADVSYYRALHETDKRTKGKLSRFQFFLIATITSFCYSIVPGYFFPSITALSFVCWIWKDSVLAQQIGSGMHGLGVGSFAMDWMTITSFLGSPLAIPVSVILNIMAGFILVAYIVVPIAYWNNFYDARRFPIVSSTIFRDDGQFYNVSRILDAKTLTFDEEAYDNYSKIHFSSYLTYCYGFTMASFTAGITHVLLFHGRSVWNQLKQAYNNQEEMDIHTRLMRQNYAPIPQWWFYSILVSMVGFAIFVCERYNEQLQLRYWGILLACALAFIFVLPKAIILATSGQMIFLDFLLEVLIGYLDPGKPIGNMAFRIYASMAVDNAVTLTSTLKTSHYMKIPPRVVFMLQVIGTSLSSLMSFAVAWWMIYSIENICRPELLPKGSPWTCPVERIVFTNGVVWGGVGPSRIFYPRGIYSFIYLFPIVGVVAPVLVWILSRRYPEKRWIKDINWAVLFGAANTMPYSRPVNYWSWFVVGFTFNYVVFNRWKKWWARYNYVLSAGLSAGGVILVVLVSVCFEFHNIYGVNWWGLELDDHCPLAECPTAAGVFKEGCPVN